MTAAGSTIWSCSAFAVTLSLSRGTTATCEKSAPAGFQHLVQPQTWLWKHWLSIVTSTLLDAQRHCSLPPAKVEDAGFTPLSTWGWMFMGDLLGLSCVPRKRPRCGSIHPHA